MLPHTSLALLSSGEAGGLAGAKGILRVFALSNHSLLWGWPQTPPKSRSEARGRPTFLPPKPVVPSRPPCLSWLPGLGSLVRRPS